MASSELVSTLILQPILLVVRPVERELYWRREAALELDQMWPVLFVTLLPGVEFIRFVVAQVDGQKWA